jgi:uncharacterized protein (TIGR02145 family)
MTSLLCKSQSVTDIDGNQYIVVSIGEQTWLKENLRTSKYNDGGKIEKVTDNSIWSSINEGAYCWYSNDSIGNELSCGKLYNWHTVSTNKLCPNGWRVPDVLDWIELIDLEGGPSTAYDILINKNGFDALPSGFRDINGDFYAKDISRSFWTLDSKDSLFAYLIEFESSENTGVILKGSVSKKVGIPIRCLKSEKDNIKAKELTSVTFYPNPVSDIFYIRNNGSGKIMISIYNLQGILIHSKYTSNNYIDLSGLENGSYIIKLNYPKVIITGKIIKN